MTESISASPETAGRKVTSKERKRQRQLEREARAQAAGEAGEGATKRSIFRKPTWSIDDGTLVALKWLAIISMVVDHFNSHIALKYGFYADAAFYFGRLAAPLFAVILGYNLARPSSETRPRSKRAWNTFWLLLLFFFISLPVTLYARPPWIAINIMLGLAIGVSTILMSMFIGNKERHLFLRIIMVLVLLHVLLYLGWLSEFAYSVPVTMLFTYLTCRVETWKAKTALALIVVGSILTFVIPNENHYAMLSLPVLFLATCINWPTAKRLPKLFFYIFYPAHILLFALIGNAYGPEYFFPKE